MARNHKVEDVDSSEDVRERYPDLYSYLDLFQFDQYNYSIAELKKTIQDCFTHNNFFQVALRLLLLVLVLSFCLPLLLNLPASPFVIRNWLTAADGIRGGDA